MGPVYIKRYAMDEYHLSGIRKSVTVRLPATSVPCSYMSVQHDTDINKKQEMEGGGHLKSLSGPPQHYQTLTWDALILGLHCGKLLGKD